MTLHSCRRTPSAQERVDFGPAYYFIESTYLVPAGSAIKSIDEVNRPGRRIVAISNTTTARSARRTAPAASVEEVPSVDQMTEMARQGQGDAFALSHNLFAGLLPKLPGARILPGNFQQTGIAVAVPKDRQVCTEDRKRAARRREEIRPGKPCARCRRFSRRSGSALGSDPAFHAGGCQVKQGNSCDQPSIVSAPTAAPT